MNRCTKVKLKLSFRFEDDEPYDYDISISNPTDKQLESLIDSVKYDIGKVIT